MTEPRLWSVTLTALKDQAEQISNALQDNISPEALSVSLFEVDGEDAWRVEALYEDEPPKKTIAALIEPLGFDGCFQMDAVPEVDWVERSLKNLAPIRAGRFFVTGSHRVGEIPAGAIPIVIDAGLAFGTGHHGTTRGCLLSLDRILRARKPDRILDLGCGAGILAIAWAKAARRPVLAADIDPVAVEITAKNARANGVGPLIRAVESPGFENRALRESGPFDLIVANILARPLVQLAPAFAAHTAPGSAIVLSGLLEEQEQRVRAAFRGQGFTSGRRSVLEGWVTLELRR